MGFSLNQAMLVRGLEALKLTEVEGDPETRLGNKMWRDRMIDEQIALLAEPVNSIVLLQKHGGAWLGTLREWIKCKAINGCDVSWGSDRDQLRFTRPITPAFLEELGSRIAAAAINETKGLR